MAKRKKKSVLSTQELFNRAIELETAGFADGDLDAIRIAHRLVSCLVQISQLHQAFHKSPRRAVDGKGGVCEQLGLTHNAVYERIRMVDLEADDFRNPEYSLDDLASKSKMTRKYHELVVKAIDAISRQQRVH